jgi:predicted metalloendopeptidase
MYRAYVPLQNIDAFYTAFDIKEGDKMYVAPEDRVKIW